MMKTNALTVGRIILATGFASATVLATENARAEWVMGAVQESSTYFTEIVASMTVPEAPLTGNSQEQFSLWQGLEDSQGDLIQTPLGFNQGGVAGWSMHNEVATLSSANPGFIDNSTAVSTGDTILTVIWLDGNGGSQCNLSTGANCNYRSAWEDLTSGQYAYISHDFTMASGPKSAMGAVFETVVEPFHTCNDLPTGDTFVYSLLYQFGSSSNVYSSVTANYTVETPGSNFPFQFGNQALDKGDVYPSCAGIGSTTESSGEGETILLWNI